MRDMVATKPDEIRHDAQSTRAKLAELCHEPGLRDHEVMAQTLADLEVDLARLEAEVDRARPSDGISDMLRLDLAELKDAPAPLDPALERQIRSVAAGAAYIERRMKELETKRAAALRQRTLRQAGLRIALGVVLLASPFVLGYARARPLLTSAQVLAGTAAVASAVVASAG